MNQMGMLVLIAEVKHSLDRLYDRLKPAEEGSSKC
jgi:hypothetical protein